MRLTIKGGGYQSEVASRRSQSRPVRIVIRDGGAFKRIRVFSVKKVFRKAGLEKSRSTAPYPLARSDDFTVTLTRPFINGTHRFQSPFMALEHCKLPTPAGGQTE